jgi:hypothetical protein
MEKVLTILSFCRQGDHCRVLGFFRPFKPYFLPFPLN